MDGSSFINGPSMLQDLTEKDINEEDTQEEEKLSMVRLTFF